MTQPTPPAIPPLPPGRSRALAAVADPWKLVDAEEAEGHAAYLAKGGAIAEPIDIRGATARIQNSYQFGSAA
jgi:hypothetical protein